MRLLYSQAALAFLFASQVSAQFSQKVTIDNGKTVYIPTAGRTSSVAAPQYTPTLVYNCQQMPLICENVAAWAKAQGDPNGDIKKTDLVFYFDPNTEDKDKRRQKTCGCFKHDDCVGSGTSNGKRKGAKVIDIATSASRWNDIPAGATNIIKAGPNPPANQPRVAIPNVPGRFFKDGIGLSCDEYPPATFIEGGDGAQTICAAQSWQIYSGKPTNGKNVGKWPLDPKSGQRAEQDWQASVHNLLRLVLGVSSKKTKKGWGTVYPFSFTTTTLQQTSSKAWVVKSGPSTTVISKRDLSPRTVAAPTATNLVITGDEHVDKRLLRELDLNARAEGSPSQPLLPARTPVSDPKPGPRDIQRPSPEERPAFVPRALAALYPRASDCTLDFDKNGLEDVEVGDDGFDNPLPEDSSKPQCIKDNLISISDLQQVNDDLDNMGNDAYDNCCGGGAGGCGSILSRHGTAIVSLCGDQEQCIGCAQLANYVQGIIDTCGKDGGLGQAKQEINERSGLSLEVDFNSHR